MNSVNTVCISGNLTRDPESRATAGGTTVLSFSVAVNENRKDPQTGEWKDYPNYIDCKMFGRRADGVKPYLSKGTKVVVQGRLRWSQWETRDGSKRSKVEVIVDELEIMSRSPKQDAKKVVKEAYQDAVIYDEDVPF